MRPSRYAVLALLALLGPERAEHEPPGWPASLVEADFDAEIARAPLPALPGDVTIDVVCCVMTGDANAPVYASISLLLPPPDDAPASPRPTTSLGVSYVIDGNSKPPVILARPDFAVVRRLAPDVATEALGAYALAHGKLLTLDRYVAWRRNGLTTYSSLFQWDAQHERWQFFFRWDDPKGGTIVVTVDTAARVVLTVESTSSGGLSSATRTERRTPR